MTKVAFVSVLAARLAAFVKLRRSLGFELRSQVYVLGRFDKVMAKEMLRRGPVTRQHVEAYLRALDGLRPLTRRHRLCHIRQFLLYLKQFEPDTFIPDHSLAPAHASPRAPHIYPEGEIRALLQEAARFPYRCRCRRWLQYQMLFGLLYVTGMRISEALALAEPSSTSRAWSRSHPRRWGGSGSTSWRARSEGTARRRTLRSSSATRAIG